jgi:hypothetical protein
LFAQCQHGDIVSLAKLHRTQTRGNFRAAFLLWGESLRYDADFQVR